MVALSRSEMEGIRAGSFSPCSAAGGAYITGATSAAELAAMAAGTTLFPVGMAVGAAAAGICLARANGYLGG